MRRFISIWLTLVNLILMVNIAGAQEMTASWYSVKSLHEEGTWSRTKGEMANGERFQDDLMVCATRLYPLGSILRIKNVSNGFAIRVRVADRIAKRFGKTRIDLSKRAFEILSGDNLAQGLLAVKVERVG